MPAIKRRRRTENFLLARMLCGGVERRRRPALQHISAGGVDVGEIGADRTALVIGKAVGGGEDVSKAGKGGDQRGDRPQPRALESEPGAAAEKFNKSTHSAGLAAAP